MDTTGDDTSRPSACDHTDHGSIKVATNVYLGGGSTHIRPSRGPEDDLDDGTSDDDVCLDDGTGGDDAPDVDLDDGTGDPRPSCAPDVDLDPRPPPSCAPDVDLDPRPPPSCAPDLDLDPRPSRAPDTNNSRPSLGWYKNKAGDWKFRGTKRPGRGAKARLDARNSSTIYRGVRHP